MPSRADVDACAFKAWHPLFRAVSIKSRTHPLSQAFVDYLLADGLLLPASVADEKGIARDALDEALDDVSDSGFPADDADGSEASDDHAFAPAFPELEAFVAETVKAFGGGGVVPKLDWSAPKDAVWASFGGSLKCVTPADVFLLLKASDFVAHDLLRPYHGTTEDAEGDGTGLDPPAAGHTLVLRKFYNLQPALEFRAFVLGSRLALLSTTTSAICSPTFTMPILPRRRPDAFTLSHFSFDVYVERKFTKVVLVDINPLAEPWSTLLFTRTELDSYAALPADDPAAADLPRMRIIESQTRIQPTTAAYHGLPHDLRHFHDILAIENSDLGAEGSMDALIAAMREQDAAAVEL
ncbi:cell cycle control protein Cdc123 [Thecamonas trahens ATCC 50062]|uniref:Cell cycle control protein Cdc123 n=1 Tax=Thecamonas trahens ATCC 50062 TaxID=461836 RepID=A0A0L0DTU2_THETB|nr:cell cycle control protein Cdc123 [Thecamonas trahens ATCC 50062]KNC55617.1 cell cycle control protein Cdc123 [Thecamonas trahens ATCC 50062]|eukprot:XP_013761390.1 cell cycle control protein Cdc123 [Thecamonas trahens ATCC 50062]